MRRRRHHALTQRQPMDAHVEKAADDGAESKKHHRPEMERHGGPDRPNKDWVKHGTLKSKVRSLGASCYHHPERGHSCPQQAANRTRFTSVLSLLSLQRSCGLAAL